MVGDVVEMWYAAGGEVIERCGCDGGLCFLVTDMFDVVDVCLDADSKQI
jgi:hypothetical protein